jgi:hypothetical protein
MMKTFLSVLFPCLFLIVGSGCSSLNMKNETDVTMAPSKLHEECMELAPHDVLFYSFKASDPVDFNVHCHESENIICPISQKNTAGEEGKFYADKEQFYCLMWTNIQTKPVRITYKFRVEKR